MDISTEFEPQHSLQCIIILSLNRANVFQRMCYSHLNRTVAAFSIVQKDEKKINTTKDVFEELQGGIILSFLVLLYVFQRLLNNATSILLRHETGKGLFHFHFYLVFFCSQDGIVTMRQFLSTHQSSILKFERRCSLPPQCVASDDCKHS